MRVKRGGKEKYRRKKHERESRDEQSATRGGKRQAGDRLELKSRHR